jgi:6-phosphogluconate dehydrogenase (decarboxylating)
VRGSITRYEPDLPVAYTGSDTAVTVTRREVQITVSVEILDQRQDKPLWQRNSLTVRGAYESGNERQGRERALEDLVVRLDRPRHVWLMLPVSLVWAAIDALAEIVSDDLEEELSDLAEQLHDGTPTGSELRVMQAQLSGWLEGLFHGIQTALFAQQMAARVQLEQMRRGLPAGSGGPQGHGEGPTSIHGTGQYL